MQLGTLQFDFWTCTLRRCDSDTLAFGRIGWRTDGAWQVCGFRVVRGSILEIARQVHGLILGFIW